MSKKIIATTDIKPDYSKYLYVCSRDEKTGNLNVVQVDKSARSKGQKK
jgi:hypothetical protein